MRVAMPLGGTDWGQSGIGYYVRSLIPHLAELLASAGDRLVVFGNEQELAAYASCLDERVEPHRVPPLFNRPALSAAWYLTQAGSYARSLEADVLLYPAVQRRCALRCPLPSVAVVHDLGQLKLADKYDPLRMAYFKRVMMPLMRRASHPVAISQATKKDMIEALGIPESRITVVTNGVDCERFHPLDPTDPAIGRALDACQLKQPYLLYPARLEHPAKNHLRLLEGFAKSRLSKTHQLAFAGADWGARERIEATVARLGLHGRVRMLGFVEDEHLPPLYAGADAVVMAGLTEGFGLPVLEALASGTPVCAAQAGALPEVAGPNAVYFDPHDSGSIAKALERAVSDVEWREQMGREGPAWAAARGWRNTAEGLVELCRQASQMGRTPAAPYGGGKRAEPVRADGLSPFPTVDIDGLPIARLDKPQLIEHLFGALAKQRGGWLVTANLDFLKRQARDPAMRELYLSGDLCVADGMPLLWAAALQGTPLPERIDGSGLFGVLLAEAARRGHSVSLLGGAGDSAKKTAARAREKHPQLQITSSAPWIDAPPTNDQVEAIARHLDEAKPDLLFVGFGSPKQEYLIRQLRPRFPSTWMVGVGISFSFAAGDLPRAPVWMQQSGLEWAHRLAKEPRRLAKRYLVDDAPYGISLLGRAWLKRRHTPPLSSTGQQW